MINYTFLNVCPFTYKAFAVSGKFGIPLTGLTTPTEWMLYVIILIDRPRSVLQLLRNRTIQCPKILKLNINQRSFPFVK